MSTFADRLQEILIGNEILQVELAELSGVSETTISHYLNGRRKPSLDNVAWIIAALPAHVDIRWLITGDEA